MADRSNTPLAKETAAQAAERIYHEWDAALGAKHLDAAMALYAPDCVLESPFVRHLLGAELGIVEGREKLREFVRIVFERQTRSTTTVSRGLFHRPAQANVGISALKAGWRTNGLCRGDGD